MKKSPRTPPKKSPKPIDCTNCKYNCSSNLPQDIREKICESFWNLGDYRRQKDFILSNVKSVAPKRRRTTDPSAEVKRTNSKTFFLCNKRVCQSFFLKTLSISNGPLIKAFQYKNEFTNFFDSDDQRGRHEPSNKIKSNIVSSIVAFLKDKCLADNDSKFKKKVICDTTLGRSLRTLYGSYKAASTDSCPSYSTFKRIFYENNFSLPQERLRSSPAGTSTVLKAPKNSQKVEIKSVEVVNFDAAAVTDGIVIDGAHSQLDGQSFVGNQAEVYEIQFIQIPATIGGL